MKVKKEIKIGIIVTLIIGLFLWGYNFLKGKNLLSSYNYYYSVFHDIGGLQNSNTVKVNGFTVGLVSNIYFSEGNLNRIIVEIGVKKSFQIPDNSIFAIDSDLLGGKSISILLGDSRKMANNKDTLSGIVKLGLMDKLSPIAENADRLILSIDSVLLVLQNTFNRDTQEDIQHIIHSADEMIAAERRKISAILANLESVSGNLKQNNQVITQVIANMNTFSDSLAGSDIKTTVANLNQSMVQLNVLLSGINQGEGTIGQLARNDSAYVYLQRSLEDLDKLLIDLRENPKNYVHFSLFGKKK